MNSAVACSLPRFSLRGNTKQCFCSKPNGRRDSKRSRVCAHNTRVFLPDELWGIGLMLDWGRGGESVGSGKGGLGTICRGLLLALIAYLGMTADAQAYVDPNAAVL